jgi:hypothetical protein
MHTRLEDMFEICLSRLPMIVQVRGEYPNMADNLILGQIRMIDIIIG